MKTRFFLTKILICALLGLASVSLTAAPLGTTFTYQGRLSSSSPANGTVPVTFSLWDAATGGNNVGTPPSLNRNVSVANWVFAADLDFGAAAFSGDGRWLEIRVNNTLQATRTRVAPMPNAIYASTAGAVKDGTITGASIASGQAVKSLNGLHDSVTLAAGTNITLTTNGNNLTIAASGGGGLWSSSGASIYYNGGNVGIGTINPLRQLEVQGAGDVEIGLKSTDVGGRLWTIKSGRGGVGDPGEFQIIDRTLGVPRLTISSIGNVFWGSSGLYQDQGGAIELGNSLGNGNAPYVDFHFGVGATQDFNVRLINDADRRLSLDGNFRIADGDINMTAQHSISSSGRLHIQANEDLYLNPFAGAGTVYIGGGGGPGNLTVAGGDINMTAQRSIVSSGRLHIQANEDLYLNPFAGAGTVYIGGGGGPGILHVVGSANVSTLTIRGGADLAEPFPMKEETIEKGAVVVIDKEHPGQLKLSTQAYDTRVAGIVSGANGINPGIALKQEGVLDQGQNVALSGRVYVKADASFGPIKPGDLLTTSDTPGHAMKVLDHARAQGAILGKAMSALQEGTGLVLVLVTLQ